MIILGIDPGIATTGFGVIEKKGHTFTCLEVGAILTKAGLELPARLHQLSIELKSLIRKYKPEALAIEALFFNKNVKTGIMVAQGRGVVLLCAEEAGIPTFSYTPSQVKIAVCGYGNADKKQIQQMVKSLLKLNTIPKPDDAADALAIAICHAHSAKLNSLKMKQVSQKSGSVEGEARLALPNEGATPAPRNQIKSGYFMGRKVRSVA